MSSYQITVLELRIEGQIQDAVMVDVLRIDDTSIEFDVTFKDGASTRGIFYPWEWQVGDVSFDQFEIEAVPYN